MNKYLCLAVILMSGCASSNLQTFNAVAVTQIVAEEGRGAFVAEDEGGNVSLSYAVATLGTRERETTRPLVAFTSELVITKAAVVPFNKFLSNALQDVDDAVELCGNSNEGLLLNVNSRTNEVVWPASGDNMIYTLFVQFKRDNVVGSTVEMRAHFTFRDNKLMKVDSDLIMAGLGMPGDLDDCIEGGIRQENEEPLDDVVAELPAPASVEHSPGRPTRRRGSGLGVNRDRAPRTVPAAPEPVTPTAPAPAAPDLSPEDSRVRELEAELAALRRERSAPSAGPTPMRVQ
jgi:hypothetical protein